METTVDNNNSLVPLVSNILSNFISDLNILLPADSLLIYFSTIILNLLLFLK